MLTAPQRVDRSTAGCCGAQDISRINVMRCMAVTDEPPARAAVEGRARRCNLPSAYRASPRWNLIICSVGDAGLDLVNLRGEAPELDLVRLLYVLRVALLPERRRVERLRRVDQEVERARLIQQREERDRGRDLTDDGADLLRDILLTLLDRRTVNDAE